MSGEHRVALVTGAARGIGAAVVHRLAREGWRVVAVDVCADHPDLRYPLATRAELAEVAEAHPGVVLPRVADVRDQAAMHAAVRLAVTEFGGLDAAVAGAAVMAGGAPLWETTDSDWDALYDVDLRGVLHLVRAAVPALLARPEPRTGRFVALASGAAHRGLFHLAPYCAIKHGVLGLVRGLAADLIGTGVTATAVSPGSTDTVMLARTAALYGLPSTEQFSEHQIVSRLLAPEEVAAAVCWLCRPESGAVTGTVLHADGGFIG
ncbi:MAG TPA: mycofactocin-coupled SDR family oxidoreductase [Pseudonocardia sp.]|uniref:mycofactocin-coupled SDR family oxidoreductase n=1 Tax=Pseudonocardia sp. TaxID=60912 RepID=UPI002F409D75